TINEKNQNSEDTVLNEKAPSRQEVWKMFDRIAKRYDFLNHFLSFGIDKSWRKKVAALLPGRKDMSVLDIATGTGDLLLSIVGSNMNVSRGYGIDLAKKMLKIGREKIRIGIFSQKIKFMPGDAESIPCRSGKFDAVTIAFGIRNVLNVQSSLDEMYRVLNKGGKVLILEFSLPGNPFIRRFYLFYFRYILPFLGKIISGDNSAYRYLNQTVETFPYGQSFCDLLVNSGFKNVKFIPLTYGVSTIYTGEKP
ncbi:bifunctional demethylmenaquinone methyltransferase/2-methoxy-6-polyprenyl-1,4-benzoquinol methylase UbiE, partial [candidate division KSB1 bacterium]